MGGWLITFWAFRVSTYSKVGGQLNKYSTKSTHNSNECRTFGLRIPELYCLSKQFYMYNNAKQNVISIFIIQFKPESLQRQLCKVKFLQPTTIHILTLDILPDFQKNCKGYHTDDCLMLKVCHSKTVNPLWFTGVLSLQHF